MADSLSHNLIRCSQYFCVLRISHYKNHISPKVVRNDHSSIILQFRPLVSHPAVLRFVRSISKKSPFRPTPHQGVFDIRTMNDISKAWDSLTDPHLLRTSFLVAFYGFTGCHVNPLIQPNKFSPSVHILGQDVICAPRGPPCPEMD